MDRSQNIFRTIVRKDRLTGLSAVMRFKACMIVTFKGYSKKSPPGKWRLSVDLSHPNEASVNDGISSASCSLSYVSVDETADIILKLGRNTQLAKMDIIRHVFTLKIILEYTHGTKKPDAFLHVSDTKRKQSKYSWGFLGC